MKPTTFQIDVMWDDFVSPQAAVVDLLMAVDDRADVLSVRRIPEPFNMWPTFEVTTASVKSAKAIVAKYLDVPADDAEVTEYLSH